MLRSFWLCWFWMIVAMSAPAHADVLPFYSQLGTVNAPDGQIANVSALNTIGGAIYVNSQSTAAGVGTMSLGVLPISNATLAMGGLGMPTFGAGNIGVVVLGIEGSIAPLGGVAAASFDTGVARVYSVPIASFSTANPASWTSGTLLASYVLSDPTNTLQGNPNAQAVIFSQSVINTIAENIATANQAQGRLLFAEVGTQDFINSTTFDPPAAGDPLDPEQLLLDIGETIQVPNSALPAEYQASLAALDALSMLLGLSKFSSYGAFDPEDPSTTYDYAAAFNGRLIPGVLFPPEVPEPASLVVWAMMSTAGFIVYKNRKRHALS